MDNVDPTQLANPALQPASTVPVQPEPIQAEQPLATPPVQPVAASAPAQPAAVPTQPVLSGTGKPKVLLAEDEEDARMIYLDILTNAGFEAAGAEDGQNTLNKLGEKPYDLLLLDIIMPDMDGISVLSEIKKFPAKYGTPKVVMLTNIGGDLAIEKALNIGANGYMLKSETEPGELVNIINKYLQGQNNVKLEKGLLG